MMGEKIRYPQKTVINHVTLFFFPLVASICCKVRLLGNDTNLTVKTYTAFNSTTVGLLSVRRY